MSDMDDLVLLLLPKTLEGKLRWTLEGDERVVTVQGPHIIEVTFEDLSYASIMVRNRDGIIIVRESFSPSQSSFDKIGKIFWKARRTALKVDETLDDISQRLRAL